MSPMPFFLSRLPDGKEFSVSKRMPDGFSFLIKKQQRVISGRVHTTSADGFRDFGISGDAKTVAAVQREIVDTASEFKTVDYLSIYSIDGTLQKTIRPDRMPAIIKTIDQRSQSFKVQNGLTIRDSLLAHDGRSIWVELRAHDSWGNELDGDDFRAHIDLQTERILAVYHFDRRLDFLRRQLAELPRSFEVPAAATNKCESLFH